MRILHVGNAHLVPALRALGHEVIAAFEAHPDLARPGVPFDARTLWARLDAPADLFLVGDMLGPQALPYALDDIPAPRVYYAVDIHMNAFWQRRYARLFDLAFVAQKDWVPILERDGVPARWLPWGVDDAVFHDRGVPRRHDVCFVGSVDSALRPKRAAALARLRERFDVAVFGDSPATRLAQDAMAVEMSAARIVFNEAIMGDLNFRVFEAMACGALLVTERIGNGLTDLFTPGEHLAVYEPDTLLDEIARWLADEPARARVAAAGMRLVRERHTMHARMAELAAAVEAGIPRRATPTADLDWGLTAHLTAVRGLAAVSVTPPLAAVALRRAADAGSAEAATALAEIFGWTGRDDAALDALAEARALDPGDVRPWLAAAAIEERRGRPEAAATLLRAGVGAARDVAGTTRAHAVAAIDRGVATADCRAALGAVLRECGHPLVPGLIARLHTGVPRTGLDWLTAALGVEPEHRDATEQAARLLDFLDLPDFAIQFYAMLVRTAPWDVAVRADYARILRRGYRHPEAMHQERVAAILAGKEAAVPPADPARADAARALGELALARIAASDWPGARRTLERALLVADGAAPDVAELLALVRARETGGSISRPAPPPA